MGILKKLSLVSEGREDSTIDLTDDLAKIKTKSFVIKEGVKFRIKIDFIVQREIVHGLKYVQKTFRAGIPVDKMTHMVGSYAPRGRPLLPNTNRGCSFRNAEERNLQRPLSLH